MLKGDFEKANKIAALYLPEKVFLYEFDEFISYKHSMVPIASWLVRRHPSLLYCPVYKNAQDPIKIPEKKVINILWKMNLRFSKQKKKQNLVKASQASQFCSNHYWYY